MIKHPLVLIAVMSSAIGLSSVQPALADSTLIELPQIASIPKPVDPAWAVAHYVDGILYVTQQRKPEALAKKPTVQGSMN